MRRLVVGIVVLVGLVALLVALLWIGQRRLVYFPSAVVPDPPPGGVREVTLSTADGLELGAWYLPGRTVIDRRGTDRNASDAAATVVVFHGNGGNRVGRLPLGRALAARGSDVLLVDYRGYGGNPGAPSSAGLAHDADAARSWVDARDGESGPVVYLGESLGAGVAIELATRRPPDGLVLRSPFASLADVARTHYPVVPASFLRDRWPNVDRIADVDVPTLVVAGDADEIVPVAQSVRVAEAASTADLVLVEGARHNDRALLDGQVYLDAIETFLGTLHGS